jgi:hypothetical protein
MFKATKKYVRAAPKYDESSETFKFLGVYNAGKCRFLSIAFAAFLVLTFDGRYYDRFTTATQPLESWLSDGVIHRRLGSHLSRSSI